VVREVQALDNDSRHCSAHCGAPRKPSSHVISNLVMIDDPGAWIADFDSPINIADIFCSYFPLLLMLLGLCTHRLEITSGFTLLIVEWFFQLNTFLIAFLAQQWLI
jgi:hypothetical protein